MEYYTVMKRMINAISSNMDGPRNYHTKSNIIWYRLYVQFFKTVEMNLSKEQIELQM